MSDTFEPEVYALFFLPVAASYAIKRSGSRIAWREGWDELTFEAHRSFSQFMTDWLAPRGKSAKC